MGHRKVRIFGHTQVPGYGRDFDCIRRAQCNDPERIRRTGSYAKAICFEQKVRAGRLDLALPLQ